MKPFENVPNDFFRKRLTVVANESGKILLSNGSVVEFDFRDDQLVFSATQRDLQRVAVVAKGVPVRPTLETPEQRYKRFIKSLDSGRRQPPRRG